jgi:hypothetical protein
MTRTRWIALIAILLIALFAVVVGGFLWPRPQFQRGPWTGPGAVPADSGHALDKGPPGE